MARKKKIKLLDALMESIRKKWDQAGIRDIVYLISYFAAVALSYKTLMAAKGVIVVFFEYDWINYLLGRGQYAEDKIFADLDVDVLTTSFIAAYIILKIDADDITSAVTAIKAAAVAVG